MVKILPALNQCLGWITPTWLSQRLLVPSLISPAGLPLHCLRTASASIPVPRSHPPATEGVLCHPEKEKRWDQVNSCQGHTVWFPRHSGQLKAAQLGCGNLLLSPPLLILPGKQVLVLKGQGESGWKEDLFVCVCVCLFHWHFMSSFGFKAKLRGPCRNFPYTLPPHMHNFPWISAQFPFFFFLADHMAYRILDSRPGTDLWPVTVKALNPNIGPPGISPPSLLLLVKTPSVFPLPLSVLELRKPVIVGSIFQQPTMCQTLC